MSSFGYYLVACGAILVTWMTFELTELSEGTIDWLPTGTRAISIVEPEKFDLLRADDKSVGE